MAEAPCSSQAAKPPAGAGAENEADMAEAPCSIQAAKRPAEAEAEDGAPTSSVAQPMITLRISCIPITATKDSLNQGLERLTTHKNTISEGKRRREDNIRSFSLAPSPLAIDSRYQVATVTFKEIPLALKPCLSDFGTIHIPVEVAGVKVELAVDSHFQGLTPLNNPANPSVEYVVTSPFRYYLFGS